jgi:peptide-methionine (R)-S-oxide reductase
MNHHSRRAFLIGAIASPLALQAKEPSAKSATVVIENFSAGGKSLGKAAVPRVAKTDGEWHKLLGQDSFVVTRHEGTERPYSGKYNDNHADGIYRCICCETALFDSKTKFESGTGWPSFWKPISSANVREISDSSLALQRTAVECSRCDAHLGHVFDDGPDPTGLRYCMNSVSLSFVARS